MKKFKVLSLLFILVMVTNVHAALQSRPGVAAVTLLTSESKKTLSYYFQLIREMETSGGGLGLEATFAEVEGEYKETSDSNNIDSHMMKNTEWGAIAMLAASSYGAGNDNITTKYDTTTLIYEVTASTTGNMTGVFGMAKGLAEKEVVAGGIKDKFYARNNQYLLKASKRYVDNYDDGTDQNDYTRYIPGDATYETKSFAFSAARNFVYSSRPFFIRGGIGSIFDFTSNDGSPSNSDESGMRLAIWNGIGI